MLSVLKKKPLVWLYVGGALLLLLGGFLWHAKVATDPERVFWQTIEQGLAMSGVTAEAIQDNNGTTVHQFSQFSFGGLNRTHTFTTLSQQGTVVKNEMIGTPTVDYSRYFSIKTDQKNAAGKPLDFSKIIGVWANGQPNAPQLFSQAVLGTTLPLGGMTVPLGGLSHTARQDLVRQLREDVAYTVDFKKVKKQHKNGRMLYTYDVSIHPVAYAALMKRFTKEIGLHDLDQLDPNNYKGQAALKLQFTVDARARHVAEVAAPTNGFKQIFTSYDVPVRIDLPKQTISITELQHRLSNLQ